MIKEKGTVLPVLDLWSLFDRTRFAISRLRELELAQFGLSIEQSSIFHILSLYNSSTTARELEALTMRQHHSISALVNGMTKRGLIKKSKNPGEKRYKIVLSEEGRELFSKVTITSMELSFSDLTPDDRERFASYLRMLLNKARLLLGISGGPSYLQNFMNGICGKKQALPVRELWPLLERTAFAISRLRELELSHFGLTIEQSSILHILTSYGGSATAKGLEEITMRHQNSVSALISGMIGMGIVARAKKPNERRFNIIITKEGEGLFKRETTNTLDSVFSALNAMDAKRFSQYLRILLERGRYLLGIPYQPPFLAYLNGGRDEIMVK
jgi:DNA-binding MarR family transcriptional regulator